ncbi:Acetyltransferase [Paraglaciecola mesophila]|uniref:Acetyltransferase n=1 Tax=Paraglaciecola mesophila TaxID=197222 RepID=A0A857JHQ1_9ALTE|nr:GNAT family N-acetyltransferase [Paraglaciecola mesophila]QHJ10758.1 Acetyltransferase [Paraglaciecola mesophila]
MPECYKTQVNAFYQLELNDLYAILCLRQDVFINEQQSIYKDIDNFDQSSLHVCIYCEAELVAYARVREAKVRALAKIERVVCTTSHRGKGLGVTLIRECLELIKHKYSGVDVMLSAQTVASEFYQQFGFRCQGLPYDDGGIEHIDMHLVK